MTTVPANGATNVSTSAALTLTFSERMLPSSIGVTFAPTVGGVSPTLNVAGTQATVTTAGLATSTSYMVTVTGTDMAGNPLAGTTSFSFTTVAPQPGGDTCQNPGPAVTATTTLASQSFAGAAANFSHNTSQGCENTHGGADRVYALTVPPNTRVSVVVNPSANLDVVLNLIDAAASPLCTSSSTCLAGVDVGSDGDPETAAYTNPSTSNRTVLAVVTDRDAASSTRTFSFTATFSLPGDTCATATSLTSALGTSVLSGQNLRSFTPSHAFSAANGCVATPSAPDRAYSVTVAPGRTLRLTATPGTGLDLAINLTTTTSACGSACVASANAAGPGGTETAEYTNTTSGTQTVSVVVAELSTPSTATFGLDVTQLYLPQLVSSVFGSQATPTGAAFPTVSATGRYVSFLSDAGGFVPLDTTGTLDVFVKDTVTGIVVRPTKLDGGQLSSIGSAVLSASGRELFFSSADPDVVANDLNGADWDIFAWNLDTNAREVITRTIAGLQPSATVAPEFSVHGDTAQYVLFTSGAPFTLSPPGDLNVFLRNRMTGTTIEASRPGQSVMTGCAGLVPGAHNFGRDLSPAATLALWVSFADYAPADTNACSDAHVLNLSTNAVGLVSTSTLGAQGSGAAGGVTSAAFLTDSRVLFASTYGNLVAGDTNNTTDLFTKDLLTGTLTRLNVVATGTQLTGGSSTFGDGALSRSKRYLGLLSSATNVVTGDTNGVEDCFEVDLNLSGAGAARRLNLTSTGAQATSSCSQLRLGLDGTYAVFTTSAALVPEDTNGRPDVYRVQLR